MKVVVAGSRTIDDALIVESAISLSGWQITELVTGMARGVDRAAKDYAVKYDIPTKEFPVRSSNAQVYHIRNHEMAQYADALILIWDGKSPGSRSMKQAMVRQGKPIHEVIK